MLKLSKLVIKSWVHEFPGLVLGCRMEWEVCGLVCVECVLMLAVVIVTLHSFRKRNVSRVSLERYCRINNA